MTGRAVELAPNAVAPAAYADRKKLWWLCSPALPLVPAACFLAAVWSGQAWLYALPLILWYGLVPALDFALGVDLDNPPDAAVERLENERYYRMLTYITVPLHYLTLGVAVWVIATQALAWPAYLLVALSIGLYNGLAINTAHELGHKRRALDRALARLALAVVGYGHFMVEHNKGHHKDVATPEDPASARFGESIYRFALPELPGAWKRAWAFEAQRMARQGQPVWSLRNEVVQPLLVTLALYGAIIAVGGWIMAPFLAIQTIFGWWQLTSANYLEHYGLLRGKLPDGRYERPMPHHSWNSNHIASNIVLFHLQRHSDHHAHPTRSYQSLRDFPDLPQLPSGYPAMYAVAMLPFWWRRLMDRKVAAWAKGDMTRVNIDPAQRAAVMRRWHRPEAERAGSGGLQA